MEAPQNSERETLQEDPGYLKAQLNEYEREQCQNVGV